MSALELIAGLIIKLESPLLLNILKKTGWIEFQALHCISFAVNVILFLLNVNS
jgi:hypothetical protein